MRDDSITLVLAARRAPGIGKRQEIRVTASVREDRVIGEANGQGLLMGRFSGLLDDGYLAIWSGNTKSRAWQLEIDAVHIKGRVHPEWLSEMALRATDSWLDPYAEESR